MSIWNQLRPLLQKRKKASCAAVIVAAGSAARMNGIDKMMADLYGEPVLLRTLRVFQSCDCIDEIVVVTREDLVLPVNELCQRYQLDKVRNVVLGGSERNSSVMAGLDCLEGRFELVAIHDGARPLITGQIIENTVQKAAKVGAAAPAIPMKDTVKVVQNGVIESTPDRSTLFAVQTPQVFDLDLIRGALYQAAKEEAAITDDCSAVERIGMKVHLVEGSEENLKLTTPIDLVVAKAILEKRGESL